MEYVVQYGWKDVMKYFLYLSKTFDESKQISELKMQKLLFFAYSDSLYFLNKKLFNNKIVAWKKGPAVKVAHKYFKKNNQNGNKEYNIPYSLIDDFDPSFIEKDENVAILLKGVFETYGKYDRWDLCNLTHKRYSWNKNRNSKYKVISDEDILQDYEIDVSNIEELMKDDKEFQTLLKEFEA